MQTRRQAIKMIKEVMNDGERIDRYLQKDVDGEYFTTDTRTYMSKEGPYSVPSFTLAVFNGDADDSDAQNAIDELEDMIAEYFINQYGKSKMEKVLVVDSDINYVDDGDIAHYSKLSLLISNPYCKFLLNNFADLEQKINKGKTYRITIEEVAE